MHINEAQPLHVRVITHNIRYAADPQAKGEAPWRERLPELLKQFRYHTRQVPNTLICLQEVLHHQLCDLLEGLNADGEEWTSIGVGRDDGKAAGEFVPILYRPAVWKLIRFHSFWLSDTPAKPSFGWDAGCRRVVTIGVFRHRQTSRQMVAMCTHLDNAGLMARKQSARLLVDTVRSFLHGYDDLMVGPLPVFLAGDMNSPEEDAAYTIFTAPGSPLKDARAAAAPQSVYGFKDTFTGFDGHGDNDGKRRLDYVFVSTQTDPVAWKVQGYAVLPSIFDDAQDIYLSDHRAVVADLEI